MGPYWARLLACERKIERLTAIILDLKRQVSLLRQQLQDQRST